MNSSRRQFLSILGGTAAAAALGGGNALAAAKDDSFEFLFVTDTHLQPELNATQGCDMAFKKARAMKMDFALQGGDHVYDTMKVSKERAVSLFDLYGKTEQDLGMKVYHTCGNHDCFGISSKGSTPQGDQLYGKKMFEEHFGRAYYSFDHKGVHFLVLDSVLPATDQTGYSGHIDETQLAWIADDLGKIGAGVPVIVSTHIPLVTAIDSYVKLPANHRSGRGGTSIDNSEQVIAIFDKHNVIGVLQGHTHIWETVTWRGVPYTTGGAVSGNWWKGTHLGTPEGFTVVKVADGKMITRYETYGFQSVAPENT
ncbi:metallophosphoesterase [Granulicella sp. dw_53]|uniref:metallophosphoesterase family protein n=1 Tax=Granulicella sp. dw_53 TaxID=2719792 RepID=UPI001BD538CF|nr:metallophosphoesterase [Granulicella sp. dw_53]